MVIDPATPQSWAVAFDAAMTRKTIERGIPLAWFDLPAQDRENITDLMYAVSLRCNGFGVDSACEFVFAAGRKLAQMPLPGGTK